ncbi:hypothetical protein Mal15_17930 [Stieleria maiorica]|uniref:Uncharacterized protein n=1 Tax=Stieleria maiorica TaxID=2795974 RepID=A0A5B9MB47_9BACT|nr:hypothetical protein Mal15_17930 [Stieleria maiorica]
MFLCNQRYDCQIYVVSKSHIANQFYGYIGGEDYCLADGTIWRTSSPICRIRREQSPRAIVFRRGGQHFMAVQGMRRTVEVEAVHLPRFVLETPLNRPEKHELEELLAIPTLTKRAFAKWKIWKCIRQ